MVRRLISIFITIPLAIVLIALAVSNRGSVPLHFDVFNPQNPLLTVNAPMFIWLLAALAVGVVAGGVGAWFAQGKHRKMERRYKKEADSLRFEVEDSKRKTGGEAPSGRSLALSR
ncbi:lipopolysaccharide assembly protein LapA domain-containing protein [Oricola sp.]|uniref:lipopolysaccharide assembly protein LapA domain-containing protein n=1 Tax=Oricola sp. TaxID=1979950 RepID=UPI0025EAA714|nr:lipopolysaccharide assembly protein LapA domain-containing protein [Oricola sp.]MCI5077907.1 lipopolysaccharide assembly protein LapA domain-containing protein [Oricola sp.]